MTHSWTASAQPVPDEVQRCQHALSHLRRTLRFIPIPNSRPTFSRADEISGLTVLELALRLDHVARVSETMSLVDSGHLLRSVTVDLDLRALTRRQREAMLVRPPHWTIAEVANASSNGSPAETPPGKLWIPIARQSRHHLAPVTITNGGSEVVPRLTSEITTEVVIAGMARLLRIQVASRMATRTDHRTENLIGVRARWLIERAMAHLIRYGYAVSDDAPPTTAATEDGRLLQEIRAEADQYIAGLPGEYADEFGWLLDAAVQEQLVIAMVPSDATHLHLNYSAPPIPAQTRDVPIRRRVRRFFWTSRDMTVSYHTQIPRTVNSYHLTLDAPEDIHVRRFLLVTDADRVPVKSIISELDRIAARAKGFHEAGGEVYRAELHDLFARCATLARLRHAHVIQYRRYLSNTFRQFGDSLVEPATPRHTLDELLTDLSAGKCSFWHVGSLAFHHEQGALSAIGDHPPDDVAAALRTLARYLNHSEFERDLSLDNDPREHGSHAYWGHAGLPFGPRSTEPFNADLHVTLADEPPALAESVFRMLSALFCVVGLLTILLAIGKKDTIEQADAAVAVLLLVPSILLARLDIPSTHSVLGTLRIYPRRIAYTSVAVTGLLAVTIAAQVTSVVHYALAALGVIVALMIACGAQIAARTLHRRSLVPRSDIVPLWLVEAMDLSPRRDRGNADVHFDAIGDITDSEVSPRSGVRWNSFLWTLRGWLDDRITLGPKNLTSSPDASSDQSHEDLPHPVSIGRPVETVTSAARTATERITGVAFTITHRFPTSKEGEDLEHFLDGAEAAASNHSTPASSFGFIAYGTGCEVTTRFEHNPEALESKSFIARLGRSETDNGYSQVSGLALVSSKNHGGLRNVNEVLFQLGTVPDLSLQQSLMLGHVLSEIADLAVRTEAVPVALHTPSAPPDVMTPECRDQAGLSVGPYIRLSLSNSREHAAARMDFEIGACKLAQRLGLGIHLSEGRAAFSTRTWNPVVPFERVLYYTTRDALFGNMPTTTPAEQIVFSMIGPSSVETTKHLAHLGNIADKLQLGIHAASAWQIHRTSFLHVILSRSATDGRNPFHGRTTDPLQLLIEQCANIPAPGRAAVPLHWPEAYKVVLADVAPLPDRPDSQTWIVPFWTSWDLPEGLLRMATLRDHLVHAFGEMGHPRAWITFARAKSTSHDRWQGHAKIAVEVPREWISQSNTDELGTLAKRVQESVINAIIDSLNTPATHAVNLHVAWGERWLGRPVNW